MELPCDMERRWQSCRHMADQQQLGVGVARPLDFPAQVGAHHATT